MKISSGKFKGMPLYSPDLKVRPTLVKIRQAIFNILRPIITDSIFIDLFSGTGAFGLEAISNGASKVYFVEKNNIKYIIKNCEKFKLNKDFYDIIPGDYKMAIKFLVKKNIKADIIFADPPYNKGFVAELLKNDIIKDILNKNGILIIEIQKNERKNLEQDLNAWIINKEKNYGDINILFLNLKENKNE